MLGLKLIKSIKKNTKILFKYLKKWRKFFVL
jgi:hypothetical protein